MCKNKFVVRAALSEETNNGWVWIQVPLDQALDSELAPRTIIKIKRGHCKSYVYVEARKIDDNFRARYNSQECSSHSRIPIDQDSNTVVMAEWYRDALGVTGTTSSDNKTGVVLLSIKPAKCRIWSSLRAACHHPDMVVRLGTRLGMLGTWLGVVGVWLGLIGADVMRRLPYGGVCAALVLLAILVIGIMAGRAPRSQV